MLTDSERKLLRAAWTTGPSVLADAGYSVDQIRGFFDREDVLLEMEALDREFKHAAAFDARTKYQTRKGLAQLAPGAVGMLARAMAGPKYARGVQGEILRDARGYPIIQEAEPTGAQLRAAEIVVEAVGGKDGKNEGHRGDIQIGVLIASTDKVTIQHDESATTPEQQALSRERMRNVIDRLMLRLPAVRERVAKSLPLPNVDAPREVEATVKKPRVVKKRVTPKGASGGGQKAP